MNNYKFILEGLSCATCANKIETAVTNTAEITNTTLNFVTGTICFNHNNNDVLTVQKWLQTLVDSIEDGINVTLVTKSRTNKKNNSPLILMIISVILFCFTIIFEFFIAPQSAILLPKYIIAVPYGVSVLLCGYPIFILGIKSLLKFRLDETTLLTIAVIASFCLGNFFEAYMVTILFSVGELLEKRAVEHSRKDIEKLAEIRPDTANLLTANGTVEVSAQQIKIGDTIVVKPFDRIPLDGIIKEGNTNLDASALTGESIPIPATINTKVMSGMLNCEGLITITTVKTYENSAANRIIKLIEESSATKGKSENFITRFAKIYTPIIIALAVLLAVLPVFLGLGSFSIWLSRALVFLVASCPCAMVISVPLGFYAGIGKASKLGVLIKGGKYLEALAKADTFIFDKTGTLTTGKLSLNSIETKGNLTKNQVLALAASSEINSNHPAAIAIKESAKDLKLPVLTNYSEIAGIGVKAMYNNQEVICGNYRILHSEDCDKYAIYLTIDGILQGKFTVSDTIRKEALSVITKLKSLGITTLAMLTGDNEKAAKDVANACNLTECHFDLMPLEKVNIAKQLKSKSKKTVYIGDGINDAPVLAVADCGIAMGFGSESAIQSADTVLSSGTLSKLPDVIKLSRRVMRIVTFNVCFALAVKVVILVLAALGYAPMWLAVFADTGVSILCVLNAIKVLK